jgi:peptidoglycan/xylan/chitin deacetylase (PgdA/CDA1 family)
MRQHRFIYTGLLLTGLLAFAACSSPPESQNNRIDRSVPLTDGRLTAQAVGDGLSVTFWDNQDFTGATATRIDTTVDLTTTGSGSVATSPITGIAGTSWSARWTGFVQAPATGTYTFYVTSDDGGRLWVDNTQITNNWTSHFPVETSGTISLMAGQFYPIKLEQYNGNGGARMLLSWAGPGITKVKIPQAQLSATAPSTPPTTSNCNRTQVTLAGGPYLSFIADDASQNDYTKLLPLFQSQNVRFASAIITGSVPSSLTLAEDTTRWGMNKGQVLALETAGMEIMSHTATHNILTSLSPTALVSETAGALAQLKALGTHPSDGIAYPSGETNSTVITEACKSYNWGYRTYTTTTGTGSGSNGPTFDPFRINRQGIYNDSLVNDSHTYIDQVVANKGWLILLIHSGMRATPFNKNGAYEEAIRYAKSKAVPILTPSQVTAKIPR